MVKIITRINWKSWLIVGIVGFSVGLKLWNFGVFPAALTHDEVVYAAQAKSFAVQGKTLNQRYKPWSLQPLHPMYAEFPGLLMAPFFWLFSDPILATRTLSLIMSIAMPFVLGWFSHGIWRNKKLSIIVTLVASFNPLIWQMGRLTYDAVFSAFFYLLAGAFFLNVKGKNIWLSLPLFILGFFEYQGYKLLLVPWLVTLGLLKFWLSGLTSTHWKVLIMGFAGFVVYLAVLLPHQDVANRWDQTILADKNYQTDTVNTERRLSVPNTFQRLISNRYSAMLSYMEKRFIGAFSAPMMFLNGEPAESAFAAWGHGWLYLIDMFLLVLGIGAMSTLKKNHRPALALAGFLCVAVLPAVINAGGSWYLLRMYFPNILLILLISWGVYAIWRSHIMIKSLFVGLYVISVMSFIYHFYYRYPVLGLNIGYFYERLAVSYAYRTHQMFPEKKIYIYTLDPPVMFWTYLLYTNRISPQTVDQIAQSEQNNNYTIDNVTFTTDCVDVAQDDVVAIAEFARSATPCHRLKSAFLSSNEDEYQARVSFQQKKEITIASLIDSGGYFKIYNDLLCNKVVLKPYPTLSQLSQFKLAKQSNDDFCQQWFSAQGSVQ